MFSVIKNNLSQYKKMSADFDKLKDNNTKIRKNRILYQNIKIESFRKNRKKTTDKINKYF